MRELRDTTIALLTGGESEAMKTFDEITRGLKSIVYTENGLESVTYYRSQQDWVFHINEYQQFLCHPSYWQMMRRTHEDNTMISTIFTDAYWETSAIIKLLFEDRFGKPEWLDSKVCKPMRSEFYENENVMAKLKHALDDQQR